MSSLQPLRKEIYIRAAKRRVEKKKKRDMLKASPGKAWPGLKPSGK